MIRIIARIIAPVLKALDLIKPLVDLTARWWVAWIFFKSGLTKIHGWDSTVMLFQYQYHVPLLSPYFAAILGTTAELILPVLLAIGLGSRIMILIFFAYNLVCVISYHFLWTPDGWNGLAQHINWGIILALLMTHGSGKLSLDYWLRRRHGHHLLNRSAANAK